MFINSLNINGYLVAHFLGLGDKLAWHKAFWQFDDAFSTQLSTASVDNP